MILKRKPIISKFREWYFSLPYNEIRQVRRNIISQCKIMDYDFNNWLNGKSTPNNLERKIINSLAGKDVFN